MGLKKLIAQGIIWRSFYYFSVLLVNVFLSRYLQAAGTGNLYFITVIFSFMQVVLSLGAESGVIYFASGNIIERNKLITLTAAWSFVAGVVMFCFVCLYFLINTNADKTLLYWYAAYGFMFVCGQSLTNYSLAIYYTRENYFLPNFLIGIVNLAFVLIIPGKTAPHNAVSVQWIIFLYFTTFFISGLVVFGSYILQYKNEGVPGFPNRNSFIKLIRYSITALGANAVFFLVYKVDYFFVNYSPVCTAADLGNYIQVSKIGQLMLTVPQIIASVLFPRTASGNNKDAISNAIMIIARLLSQLFLLAFIGVALIGKQFFILVFGQSFNNMQIPMLIIIPGIFYLSVLALLSAYFGGKGKIRINFYAAVIGLIVMITGDLIFVPFYGIIAAAAVSTLSYIANTSFAMRQFRRDHAIHWIEFLKWRKSDYNFLFALFKLNKSAQ